MNRIVSDFISSGIRCSGWLFLPDGIDKPPVVVMGHGMGAEKSFGLSLYAERFAAKGIASFAFDYRCFGESEGEPRNLVSPRAQLNDWQAAISHVKSLDIVNTGKIALWGTSFGGGHVLVTAAKTEGVSCAVAQVPFVDGLATAFRLDFAQRMKSIGHGLWDLAGAIMLRSPHYVPFVASPGEFALMNTPDSKAGYMALIPKDSLWENKTPARILLGIPLYRPIRFVDKIKYPVLLIYAGRDTLISPDMVEKTIARIKSVKAIRLDVGHFEVYTGGHFDRIAEMEGEFIKKCLA